MHYPLLWIYAIILQLYDWLLNINDEIFLLWLSPWSYTKGLFVLVRYLPIFSLGMDIPSEYLTCQSLHGISTFNLDVLIMGMKPSYCSWSFPMAMCASLVINTELVVYLTYHPQGF